MTINWNDLTKADIYVIAKQNDDEGRIEKVKVFFPKDKKYYTIPRNFIVSLLKLEKLTIKTATKKLRTLNEYEEGEEVTLYKDEFITTKGNTIRKDNLDNLPDIKH